MENNHVRVLRALARKSPQTSMKLAAAAGAWSRRTPHYGAVRVNDILSVELGRGRVARAGITRSSHNNVPTFLWEITPAGQAWLEEESWTWHSTRTAERQERCAMTMAQRSALIEYLDREARARGWGMDTPVAERRAAIFAMREMGCTLQAIGDIFGITREYVRLILQGHMKRAGRIIPVGSTGTLRHRESSVPMEKEQY